MVVRRSIAIQSEAVDLQARYLDDVFRYVSAFVRPSAEAEDVTMHVFHAALAARPPRDQDPRLWLLGIARRKVADCLRKHYRRREAPLESTLENPSKDVDQTVLLCQLLAALPKDYGQVLVLKYVSGLSIDEIASLLGRSPAAANSLLQRAREALFEKGAPHFLTPEDPR